jgi:hypothetical protein
MSLRFGLIGFGGVALRHVLSIQKVGGEVVWIFDPAFKNLVGSMDIVDQDSLLASNAMLFNQLSLGLTITDMDYIVICAPSYMHDAYIRMCLDYYPPETKIICEKPACLPWEDPTFDDRVQIVLQYRWADRLLPRIFLRPAHTIYVKAVRGPEYYEKTNWKDQNQLTGGELCHLFIHYLDLSMLLDCDLLCHVAEDGKQVREIHYLDGQVVDLLKFDQQELYNLMYKEIVDDDAGIKPRELKDLYKTLREPRRIGRGYGIPGERHEDLALGLRGNGS